MFEVDDIIIGEHLEVIVDRFDIVPETFGELTNALRLLNHHALHELDAPVSEERQEVTRVLEVDDVGNFLAGLPLIEAV